MSFKHTVDVLKKKVVIPEVVQRQSDAAFEKIFMETEKGKRQTARTGEGGQSGPDLVGMKKAGIILLATALAVCTVSAAALVYRKWSHGIEDTLATTQEEAEKAEHSGIAVNLQ